MTPTQKKVYDYIKSHIAEHGYSPTYRQMVVHLGYSLSNISRIVRLLKDQGLVTVSPGRARSIQLVEDDRDKLIMRMSDALKWLFLKPDVTRLTGSLTRRNLSS